MLAELVISATVVISTMVGLYSLYSKLYNRYKEKNSYYSVDAMYATKEMIDVMISNSEFNTFINRSFSTSSSAFIINDGMCMENSPIECYGIQPLYSIKNMVIVEYGLCSLIDNEKCKSNTENSGEVDNVNNNNKPLIEQINNQTFKDYIRYLVNYYDIENISAYGENESNYHYLVITELDSACGSDQVTNSSSSNNYNGYVDDEGEIYEDFSGGGDDVPVTSICQGRGKTYYASMRIR